MVIQLQTNHGNSNNFTVGGGTLTKTEDSPSNVFATLNPLDNYYANATFSQMVIHKLLHRAGLNSVESIIMCIKGKYYWEVKDKFIAPFSRIQPIPSFGNMLHLHL